MEFSPNVFILGFQKCGSSTLFHYLIEHPSITGSIPKETFFLVDPEYDRFDYSKNINNSDASWSDFFKKTKNETDIFLEASVCNFYQKRAFDYITKNNEDIKVIFIVRNPIDRFQSVYRYLYGKVGGIPPGHSINDFFRNVKSGVYNKGFLKHAIKHGKYSEYISKWERSIGERSVLVLSFKELINNPQEVVNKVCTYLNVSNYERDKVELHKNKSLGYRFPRLHKQIVTILGGSYLANITFVKRIYYSLFSSQVKAELSKKHVQELMIEYEKEFAVYGHLF